jgi:serine/threonine-protein kinase
MIGQALGAYTIQAMLGSGGTGYVYAAFDRRQNRTVAIKILRPEFVDDPELLQRFRQEADSLARLTHPNITEFYALEHAVLAGRQSLFIVMELIDGITLEEVIAHVGRLGPKASLAIMAQAIAGLSYAHGLGTIHRDIKPSNLMLNEAGVLKIMDFGIARVEGSDRLTRQGMIVGTLAYIAPEQIKGDAGDARSDIYSLGCVLYKLLAGVQPFRGTNDYELIRAHIEQAPQPLNDLAPDLAPQIGQAVMRALAKDPAERFQSLDEFAEQLVVAVVRDDAATIIRTQVLPAAGRAALAPVETDATVLAAPRPAGPPAAAVQPAEPTPSLAESIDPPLPAARPAGTPAAAAVRPWQRWARKRIVPLGAAAAAVTIFGAGYLIEQSYLASTDLAMQTASSPASETRASPPPSTPLAAALIPSAFDAGSAARAPDPATDALPNPTEPAGGAGPAVALIQSATDAGPAAVDAGLAARPPDVPTDTLPNPEEPADNIVPETVAGDVSAYAGEGWPVIEGHVIRLSGLDLLAEAAAKPAAAWIKAHGNFLDCRLASDNAYRCLTRQNLDLAQAILLNGGARASVDAPVAYRDAEAEARKEKRGLWR